MTRTIILTAALPLAALLAAPSALAQMFIQPGSYGSVTLTVLDGATTMAGGVLRVSNKVLREDEDYMREAVLWQMPLFTTAPATFSAPFAHRRRTRTRILMINTDDLSPIRVRTTFYHPDGSVIGCNETELAPHQRKSRLVQAIPLTGCP